MIEQKWFSFVHLYVPCKLHKVNKLAVWLIHDQVVRRLDATYFTSPNALQCKNSSKSGLQSGLSCEIEDRPMPLTSSVIGQNDATFANFCVICTTPKFEGKIHLQ